LSTAVERELADGCDKIQVAEEEVTGKLGAIEAQQPGRTLAGLGFRLKGRDRARRFCPGCSPLALSVLTQNCQWQSIV
jgi:hypothetical protein